MECESFILMSHHDQAFSSSSCCHYPLPPPPLPSSISASAPPSILPLATHQLLPLALRSFCRARHSPPHSATSTDWVYSVFWRIIPRNYPPPQWDTDAGTFDRTKGSKRRWILAWEDGYCNFFTGHRYLDPHTNETSDLSDYVAHDQYPLNGYASSSDRFLHEPNHHDHLFVDDYTNGLQPEIFFKMSHEIYNYGEGLMGKVAAENSYKWIYRDAVFREHDNISVSQGLSDIFPRTWEAQFKAGIQTIAIVSVGELGLLQLGSTKKISEDLNFVLMLQRKFNCLQNIPGVFSTFWPTTLRVTVAETGKSLLQNQETWSADEHADNSILEVHRALQHEIAYNHVDILNTDSPTVTMPPHQVGSLCQLPNMAIPPAMNLRPFLAKLPSLAENAPNSNLNMSSNCFTFETPNIHDHETMFHKWVKN